MGFLDKVKGAVSTAKDELDKSGLVDKAKDKAREQFKVGTPGEDPAPVTTADETTRMVDAIRLGAVDPATLISAAEVATIAGREVRRGRPGFDDTFCSVIFEVGSGGKDFERLTLSVCHSTDDETPWDADEYWDFVRGTYGDEAITIAGLGEDAFRQDTYVWAKDAGRIVFADVSADRLDDITKLNRAESMVRLAVPRLPPTAT